MMALASTSPIEVRRAAEARLAMIRQKLLQARAQKKARMKELVAACRADRLAVRAHLKGMRRSSHEDVRAHARAARAAARLLRLTRLAEAKRALGSDVDRWRAAATVERQHQEELARIARQEQQRLREIRDAHEHSVIAGAVRLALLGKLGPLFEREAIVQAPGESRAEAVLRHGERNPDKMHAALEPRAELAMAETERAEADAERAVRAVGGSTLVKARPPHAVRPPRRARRGAQPSPTAAATAAVASAAVASAPPARKKRKAKPTKVRVAKAKVAKAKVAEPKRGGPSEPRVPKKGATPRAPTPPKRRLGQIPPGGMLLEDLLKENAQLAAKKKAKAARGRAAKPSPKSPDASPLPPAPTAMVVDPLLAGAVAANTNAPVVVSSTRGESVQPYKVRASCGHIVVRPMRAATAGVPYSDDVVLDAPRGRACDACEAKKDYGKNAPCPPPMKHGVKAPELRDTAEIAKRIRADVLEAVRAGRLPKARYSVTTDKYSLGSTIGIRVSGLPFALLNPDAFRIEAGSRDVSFNREAFRNRYTPEAEKVQAALEAIVDAYHWDKSDPQTDYHHERFGRDLTLEDESKEWAKINEAKRAAGAATEATRAAPTSSASTRSSSPTRARGRSSKVQQTIDFDSPLFLRTAASSGTAASPPLVQPSVLASAAPAAEREPNAYEQKKTARIERTRARADKLRAEAEGAFARERSIGSVIPFGQPILIGHHSEARHRRDIKRMHSLANKGIELTKHAEELERRADAAESGRAVSSDDPDALDKLRSKADALAKDRDRMRAANAAIRKGGDVVARLVAMGFSEGAAKMLLEKDSLGRIGFADYKLSNTGAEERRVRERIRQLEARASATPPPPETIGEATMAEQDNRVRITFPSKPSEEIRAALKGAGFHWAPSEGAWQRFASAAAWFEGRRVLLKYAAPSPSPLPSPPKDASS